MPLTEKIVSSTENKNARECVPGRFLIYSMVKAC